MKRPKNLEIEEAAKGGDEPFKQESNYPTFASNFIRYVKEFTENTSIHGVRYLGERKRSILEKFWWLAVFVVSLYICICLIAKTYSKWDNSADIVIFGKNPTPVWQIPFPAVTICPETKSRQSAFNFTEYYHMMLEESEDLTPEELKMFGDMALVCDNHLYHEGSDTADYHTIDFISEVSPQFNETLWQCRWTDTKEDCDELFTPILTDQGVCYTFNMLDRDDIYRNEVAQYNEYLKHGRNKHGWTLERGYSADEGKYTFPRRALSAGFNAGLLILMRAYEYDLDYICKGPVQGFKVLLHQPGEVPRVSSQYFRVPLNQEVVVAVKPDMMTTSGSLINYDPKRRHCYFSTERNLRYYQNYTQQNCEVECLTNYTLSECGCVAYHMPRNESTDICGPTKIVCMNNARNELLANQVDARLLKEPVNKYLTDASLNCDCLPACTSLTYNVETSQADFNWRALFAAFKADIDEFPGVMMSRVTIFFKEQQFITSERNELYGLADFLANCGGLLCLFLGFSFLSAVEILYFLTLRLVCNICRYGRHYWSGSPELVNNAAYIHNK